jgi:hypothetical protein
VRTHKLKRQLQEMNLFSAKLLYVNKIFNGQNVTAKQRRAIVEAMDNAKTLREAKLLYRSLNLAVSRQQEEHQADFRESSASPWLVIHERHRRRSRQAMVSRLTGGQRSLASRKQVTFISTLHQTKRSTEHE